MFTKHNKAQSLIETIVAVSIVVTAVVAILAMGVAHLSLGGQSAERVMAANLAREGIEVILAVRNSNWLDPDQSWPYGLTNDDYIVNFNSYTLTTATFDGSEIIDNCTNCYLCHQASGDYEDSYLHCAQQQVFSRMMTIADGDDLGGNCSSNCEKKITSTVYWLERGRSHTITLEARITDWR